MQSVFLYGTVPPWTNLGKVASLKQRSIISQFESEWGYQAGVSIMDNTAVFYTVNMGSIPVRRTKKFCKCQQEKSRCSVFFEGTAQ